MPSILTRGLISRIAWLHYCFVAIVVYADLFAKYAVVLLGADCIVALKFAARRSLANPNRRIFVYRHVPGLTLQFASGRSHLNFTQLPA